jgi:hypothetical protein
MFRCTISIGQHFTLRLQSNILVDTNHHQGSHQCSVVSSGPSGRDLNFSFQRRIQASKLAMNSANEVIEGAVWFSACSLVLWYAVPSLLAMVLHVPRAGWRRLPGWQLAQVTIDTQAMQRLYALCWLQRSP